VEHAGARKVVRASATFALISLLAYLLSFVKSLVVARYFGTSAQLDAFTLAVLIPNLVGSLLTGGFAISLVPSLASAELKTGFERANTFRAGLLLSSVIACIPALLLATFATSVMILVAPKLAPAQQMLAATLLRLCAPILPLTSVYAYCSAELLSRKKYVVVAAAPIITTAISIATILLFPFLGVGALAIGLALGMFFQALTVALPAWFANKLPTSLRWWSDGVKELARQQMPLLLISTFGVANISVDQFMAGLLPSGSAAALSFASNLNTVVTQVVVMAASWVILPELSKLAAEHDFAALKRRVQENISGVALVAIPVAIGILVFGGPTVRLLFQHGQFDSNSTYQVSRIWIGYTIGLVPFAFGMIPVRLLNALKENHFLVRVGLTALIVNAVLDYILMRLLGPVGISVSTSLVYVCTSILVFRFIRKPMPGVLERSLLITIFRALLVCVPLGATLAFFRHLLTGTIGLLIGYLIFSGGVLALYYWAGVFHIFRSFRATATA